MSGFLSCPKVVTAGVVTFSFQKMGHERNYAEFRLLFEAVMTRFPDLLFIQTILLSATHTILPMFRTSL